MYRAYMTMNPKGFDTVIRCFVALGFVVATKNIHNLMFHHFSNCISCRSEILTRIEVRGVESEVFADCAGDGKTQVGVDVDLANCHGRCLAEHLFGDALCAWHAAAVFVDFGDELLRDGRCAVKDDRESGETSADFFENVEAELGLTFEFVCAV